MAFYGKMQEFGVVGQFCLFCESCNGHKKYTVLVMAELVGMYLTIISLVNISIKAMLCHVPVLLLISLILLHRSNRRGINDTLSWPVSTTITFV